MGDGSASAKVVVKDTKGAEPLDVVDDFHRRKMQLYSHWVRPRFLQYNYMYHYRHNYYDDVIDYLDSRARGMPRDIPRPQYWAERVLRTERKMPKSIDEMYNYTNIGLKRDSRKLMYTLRRSPFVKTYFVYRIW
ncbi:flightin isoform X2 [Toxorhynchites rutilus septentrionalis]|uniref:flightin isoform X2 n=1 Tax=Toxorhynchites rutilus septentrionalis TaxID=329112 RepID=UPI00247836E6|nr:flightin isoform X2 [Toxorhynchites rutilus septentrionalis]